MQIIKRSDKTFQEKLSAMLDRSAFSDEIESSVREILFEVRSRGDSALCEFALKYDSAKLQPEQFKLSEEEIAEAVKNTPAEVRAAIDCAIQRIKDFSTQQLPENWSYNPRKGVTLGEQFSPLDRVGCYIPGGTAPLVSTAAHTIAIAAAAKVPEIVAITPAGKDGKVNHNLLYACHKAGASEIYRLGGVYGIAALAYGTESIKKVEKIVGPGNAYVTAAKRQVYGHVSLDLVAGPSEILVIADKSANPAYIAADMLSQAEHGSGKEQAVLLSTDAELLPKVEKELLEQSKRLSRSECLLEVLQNGVFLIEVKDLQEAVQIANIYAPEHLEIMCENAPELAKGITSAGGIFIGEWTPEPVGDFLAGPSHVLPTGGSARFFAGLSVEAFFRRNSIVQYDKAALKEDLPYLQIIAACEGLDAHAKSASIRFDN